LPTGAGRLLRMREAARLSSHVLRNCKMPAARIFERVGHAEKLLLRGCVVAMFHQMVGGDFGASFDATGFDLVARHYGRDHGFHARSLTRSGAARPYCRTLRIDL